MDCPTCGKSLNTEQGMRQHHTKVHGDPLPNRTCKGCEVEFYDPKAQRAFCDECNPNAGKNNENYSGAKERITCKLCDSEFSYYPSDKKGVYCSECVSLAEGLLPENPSEKIERVTTECPSCGKELQVLQSRLERQTRGIFCDQACHGEWLSENIVGENHHQWEGGTIKYGQKWWRIRRKALERDEHTCLNCGRNEKHLEQNPDVHHINRVRDFDDKQDAHTLDNVITLCRSCHRNVEAGNIEVPR
jgi:hypothetical protein